MFRRLGTFMLPLTCSMDAHIQSICMNGTKAATMKKYFEASEMISGVPPSQRGSGPETAIPTRAMHPLKTRALTRACRSTSRADLKSLAPIRWATWTEKPLPQAPQKPPRSHAQVDTRPMDAPAAAPRCPTMDVSIYCISTMDSWAIMAG